MSGTLNIYNNVSFALYRQTKELTRLQEQTSTGSRINRVSDDPPDAYRILGLKSQERSLENYINNLSEMIGTLEMSSIIIDDITAGLAEMKTNLTQVTGGIYDEEGRQTIAEGFNDMLEQIVALANTKHAGQYLFGGSNTTSIPYVVERTNGEITSVVYQGSDEQRNIEVAPGLESSAFYAGDNIFRSSNRGDPIFLGDTGAKAGTGTSNVRGNIWLTVKYEDDRYKLSIDDGANWVEVPQDGDTNLAVKDSDGNVLYVDTTEINNAGVEMVSIPGTYDVFDTLISIRDVLENERGLSDAQLEEILNNSLDMLDEISNLMVQTGVSVGSKIGFLSNLKDNLTNIEYDTEDEVTRLQEADIAQVAIDLSRYELLYEMSLAVAGELLSLSLLDFIE